MIFFSIIQINNFRGDLTDVSAGSGSTGTHPEDMFRLDLFRVDLGSHARCGVLGILAVDVPEGEHSRVSWSCKHRRLPQEDVVGFCHEDVLLFDVHFDHPLCEAPWPASSDSHQ